MGKINDLGDLERRVEELEAQREVQKKELQANFRGLANELSPATLIRKGVREIVGTPGFKATAVDTAVGSGVGFITRKLFVRGSGNIFRKLGGAALQFIISNIVRNRIPMLRGKKKLNNKTVEKLH